MHFSKSLIWLAVVGCGSAGSAAVVAPSEAPGSVDNTASARANDLGQACGSVTLSAGVTMVEPRQAIQIDDNVACVVRGSDTQGNAVGVVALMRLTGRSWRKLDTIDFNYEIVVMDEERYIEGQNGEVTLSTLEISPNESALVVATTTTRDGPSYLENKTRSVVYRVHDSAFNQVLAFDESQFTGESQDHVTRDIKVTNTLTLGFYDLVIAMHREWVHMDGDETNPDISDSNEHYVWNGTSYSN